MTEQFAITTVDVDLPMLGDKRLDFSSPASAASRSTILVGRNGTGKSTILREIAMSFRAYFTSQQLRSRQGIGRVSRIGFTSDSEPLELNIGTDSKTFQAERTVLRSEERGPSRLIALSFTPFDKFPPADDIKTLRREDAKSPFYVYLGYKNDFRASPRARLLRSIDQLASAWATPQSDYRAVDAFAAIGYLPTVEITYTFDPSRAKDPRRPYDEGRLAELAHQISWGISASGSGKSGEIRYFIDFASGLRQASIAIGHDEILELVSMNVLRLASVTMHKPEGYPVEMLELSSGELNLLSGFLGLAAFLDDGCLVLIDEPENSLHPEWQLRYTSMLEAVLARHPGCHYVIATHSPLVVSGATGANAKVLRLDQEPIELAGEIVADTSPDATLVNAFRLVTPGC